MPPAGPKCLAHLLVTLALLGRQRYIGWRSHKQTGASETGARHYAEVLECSHAYTIMGCLCSLSLCLSCALEGANLAHAPVYGVGVPRGVGNPSYTIARSGGAARSLRRGCGRLACLVAKLPQSLEAHGRYPQQRLAKA